MSGSSVDESAARGTTASRIEPQHSAGRVHPYVRVAPFAEGGVGKAMYAGLYAYLAEYVYSPDDGWDHEPTEFERILLEDFAHGLISDERFFGPVRRLMALAGAPAEFTAPFGVPPADGEAIGPSSTTDASQDPGMNT